MKQYRFASKKGRHICADSKRKTERPHINDNAGKIGFWVTRSIQMVFPYQKTFNLKKN